MVKTFYHNPAAVSNNPLQHGIRGKSLCRECRHRRKPCIFSHPDDDCEYCRGKGVACGPKVSKQEFHCREGEANTSLYSMQANAFIEFWMKSMRIHTPSAREDDLLTALGQSVETKQNLITLKRRRADSDPIARANSASEMTPPAKKRSLEGERDEFGRIPSPYSCSSEEEMDSEDFSGVGSDAKEEDVEPGRFHLQAGWEMRANGPLEGVMSGSFSMDASAPNESWDDWERVFLASFGPTD